MATFIVKMDGSHGPFYLEWSSVVDAPVTYGMTLDEFKDYYRHEYGERGMEKLPERLARVEAIGTSAIGYNTLDDLIGFNRAGKGESILSKDELYRQYCVTPPPAD